MTETGQRRVIAHAHGRVGFLGNPSDGYFGKTISFALRDFVATVTLEEHDVVEFVPNPSFDRFSFASLEELHATTERAGHYGGIRLVRAACKRFVELCKAAGVVDRVREPQFRLSYDTTVPVQVGMAGSSAIITATFKALMRFYRVTAADLGVCKPVLPAHILAVEKEELGIAAGLQDRVAQVYQGLVYMDFDESLLRAQGHGLYEPLDAALLPTTYVAWVRKPAGESGKAHNNVRSRWEGGDEEARAAMRRFASFAEEGKAALEGGDVDALCRLVDANFDLRRELFGDDTVGHHAVQMVVTARKHGFAAKFTGSGGAIVMLRREPVAEEELARLRDAFDSLGCDVAEATPQASAVEEFA